MRGVRRGTGAFGDPRSARLTAPLIAAILSVLVFALPVILGMTLGNAGRGGNVMLVTMASAMILVSLAVQILSGWIAAFLADVPYATIIDRR